MSDIKKVFYELRDRGFTTFDCADIYTGAEEFIGSFIAELKKDPAFHDEDIQVHTKFVPDLEYLDKVDFQFTEKMIDRALLRLHKDILDVVQFHWWDYDVDGMIRTAGYLNELRKKGKIRCVSGTNFDTKHLAMLIDADSVFPFRPSGGKRNAAVLSGSWHFLNLLRYSGGRFFRQALHWQIT